MLSRGTGRSPKKLQWLNFSDLIWCFAKKQTPTKNAFKSEISRQISETYKIIKDHKTHLMWILAQAWTRFWYKQVSLSSLILSSAPLHPLFYLLVHLYLYVVACNGCLNIGFFVECFFRGITLFLFFFLLSRDHSFVEFFVLFLWWLTFLESFCYFTCIAFIMKWSCMLERY